MIHTQQNDSRRNFIKKLGAAGFFMSTMSLPSYALEQVLNQPIQYSPLKPVNVSPERIIRQVVGLRPYRPSGFNLSVQKLDEKAIIHNYGHGGGGISLSWGTASLAIEKIEASQSTPIAVLGAGVIGLSSAILLLKQGRPVTIYTDRLPPNTTSNVAAAYWAPVSVFESGMIATGFMDEFNRASIISQRMFQDLVGSRYGVWWIKSFFLGASFDFPGGKNLYPDYKQHNSTSSPFTGFEINDEVYSLMIEPPIYMKALLDDFYQLGGKLIVRKFNDLNELNQLKEPYVMNCTGLGSHDLFKDKSLIPVQGQLAVLLPQEEINYGYVIPTFDDLLYMFPRKDGIILGGTSEKGNWSLNPNDQELTRIMEGHKRIAAGLKP
ncbi:Glycine/D-amino acid oxidase [Ekhidna lutea]|uniref:D-amino-acid oxidase n=1 Tax=Ekhidna lutea TaxID=447679 RepID=A0A239HG55_EKHLU|nr:FAD-dependent oxidoreductase [Ekhidna lutea]SNS80389.1 Glycine/D-amino acid oxidase [Ekhidna lutea]